MDIIKYRKSLSEEPNKVDFSIYQAGVYFLYRDDEIVYIGQTNNFMRRLVGHLEEGSKLFDGYTFTPVPLEAVECVENKLINWFSESTGSLPLYNKKKGTTKIYHNNRAKKVSTAEAMYVISLALKGRSPFKDRPLDLEDIGSRFFRNALRTAKEALYIHQKSMGTNQ